MKVKVTYLDMHEDDVPTFEGLWFFITAAFYYFFKRKLLLIEEIKEKECDYCLGEGYRIEPNGEGSIERYTCGKCGGSGFSSYKETK